MATKPRSERDIELDAAALSKAEAGGTLSEDEDRRVQAAEARWRCLHEAIFAGFEEYTQAGIAERTKSGGYSIRRDVLEAERQEHEHRSHKRSRVPFRLAVVRRVRETRLAAKAGLAAKAVSGPGASAKAATRRPRPRSAGRSRSRSPGGGADSDGESAAPPSVRPAGPLTAAGRRLVKAKLDAVAARPHRT